MISNGSFMRYRGSWYLILVTSVAKITTKLRHLTLRHCTGPCRYQWMLPTVIYFALYDIIIYYVFIKWVTGVTNDFWTLVITKEKKCSAIYLLCPQFLGDENELDATLIFSPLSFFLFLSHSQSSWLSSTFSCLMNSLPISFLFFVSFFLHIFISPLSNSLLVYSLSTSTLFSCSHSLTILFSCSNSLSNLFYFSPSLHLSLSLFLTLSLSLSLSLIICKSLFPSISNSSILPTFFSLNVCPFSTSPYFFSFSHTLPISIFFSLFLTISLIFALSRVVSEALSLHLTPFYCTSQLISVIKIFFYGVQPTKVKLLWLSGCLALQSKPFNLSFQILPRCSEFDEPKAALIGPRGHGFGTFFLLLLVLLGGLFGTGLRVD